MSASSRIACLLCLALALVATGPPPAHGDASEARRRDALRLYQEGEQALQARELDRAEAAFRKAIELDPLQTLAHYGLGQTYLAMRRHPEALAALDATRLAFEELAAARARNEVDADIARDQEIRELRDTLRMLQTTGSRAPNVDLVSRRVQDRIDTLEREKRREGDPIVVPAGVWLAIGAVQFRMGDTAAAEQAYRKAIGIDPKLGEAHNNLAVLYMTTGRLEEAESALEAAEKSGFTVHPQFKADLKKKQKEARDAARR